MIVSTLIKVQIMLIKRRSHVGNLSEAIDLLVPESSRSWRWQAKRQAVALFGANTQLLSNCHSERHLTITICKALVDNCPP